MNDRPPFDALRASFWLIALVISIHCVVVLSGVGLCLWHAVEPGQCDPTGRLGDLLVGALAVALAFSALRKPPDDPR